LAKFCSDLGGDVMVFGSPHQRNLLDGVTREQGVTYATEVFRKALPTLAEREVLLALEPLTTKETDFINTAAEAVELVKLVDSPQCKILLDCKAMIAEATPIPELIREHGEWMVHFHANDPNRRGPGMGKLDFVPIFEALKAIEYRGWISVEVFDYSPGAETLARESIEYMKRVESQVFG
jgi:sugar phosphate isomerase/epimerase